MGRVNLSNWNTIIERWIWPVITMGFILLVAVAFDTGCEIVDNLPKLTVPTTLSLRSSRGTLAQAEPYNQPVVSGTANFGAAAGQTSLNWLDFGHLYRFRETGIVSVVKVAVPDKTGITGFYISNCRTANVSDLSPNSVDTVSTSNNLASQISQGINTLNLTSALSVQEGDYICGRIEWSGGSTGQNLYLTPAVSASDETAAIYVTSASVTSSAYNWTKQSSLANQMLIVEADMPSPVFACTGDSITSGYPLNHSFADTASAVTNLTVPFCEMVASATHTTTQNFGHSGYYVSQIFEAFAAGPAAVNPQYSILEGGTNDFALGPLTAPQVEAQWLQLLNANAAISSAPVIIGIPPLGTFNPPFATLSVLEDRDAVNTWLAAEAVVYHGVYVDPDLYLGTFNSAGPAGNLWSICPTDVQVDGLHLTLAGNILMTQAILDSLNGTPRKTPLGCQ
jgi:lysophospholipase L1-like esterase